MSSNAFIEDQQREAVHGESDVSRKYQSYYSLTSPVYLAFAHVTLSMADPSPWQLASMMLGPHFFLLLQIMTCDVIWVNVMIPGCAATILSNASS